MQLFFAKLEKISWDIFLYFTYAAEFHIAVSFNNPATAAADAAHFSN